MQEALVGGIPLALLAALPLLKFRAVGGCAGAGVPGGLFTPTLCVGALAGGLLGTGWQHLWPGGPPGVYALIGMGALLAGATHGPVSAAVLAVELTGDLHALAPLLLACAAAAPVSRALEARSIYAGRLERHMHAALRLAAPPERSALHALLTRDVECLPGAARFGVVVERVLARRVRRPPLIVVDDRGRPVGQLTRGSIRRRLASDLPRDFLIASDLADPLAPAISATATPDEARRARAAAPRGEVPVVDRSGRLAGVARRPEPPAAIDLERSAP